MRKSNAFRAKAVHGRRRLGSKMPRPTSDRRATERKHPWPMVRLGDVCRVVLGGTPKTGIPEYWDGDIPWLTPGDMGKIAQMYVDASNCKRKITQLGLDSGSTLCPARSVILSTRAPIGYVFVNSVPMATNQGCKTLVPSDDVYPEYLCFNLLGRTDELNELGTGTTFKELATGNLKAVTLPLPPLSVQREIVARLERELAAVEKMKKGFEALAETAKAEFKAELKEVFEGLKSGGAESGTNGTRKLGEICETITDGDHQPPPKSSQGVPFLVISNVASGRISFENTRFVPRAYYEAIQENRKPRKGDVLLTVTGSYGIPVVVETDDMFCFQRHIALIRASRLDSKFLAYVLQSPESKRYFDLVATGAAQKTIGLGSIRAMSIPFPSMSAQRQIVDRLSAAKARTEKLEAKAREGVAVCETMRKAILKEAFE